MDLTTEQIISMYEKYMELKGQPRETEIELHEDDED